MRRAGNFFARSLLGFIGMIAVFMLFGCQTIKNPYGLNLVVKKQRPFLISESEMSYGWGVLSHSRLIQISENVLVLQYYVGGDNAQHANAGRRGISGLPPAVSRDGGKSWVFEGEGLTSNVLYHCYYWGYNIREINGVILGRGNSALRVDVDVNPIGEPLTVAYEKNGFKAGGPWHRLVSTLDGRLVATTYQDRYKQDGKQKGRIHFLESLDEGLHWNTISMVADSADTPWGSEWPNESTLECLPDGTLLCVMRTGYEPTSSKWDKNRPTANLLLSRSVDDGRSWAHERMKISGVYPRLFLMSNGILALATGRPGNVLYFSADNGHSWGNSVSLTPADVKTSGYCDIAEVAPGRLLAVYDLYDTDSSGIWLWEPKEVNGVYGVFVDVKRLWGGRPEVGERMSEDGGGLMSDVGSRTSDVGDVVSEDGGRRSEDGGRMSEVSGQNPEDVEDGMQLENDQKKPVIELRL